MRTIFLTTILLYIATLSFADTESRALQFDGVNDYVQINNAIGQAAAIEFWINPDQTVDGKQNGMPIMTFNNSRYQNISLNNSESSISGETITLSVGSNKVYTTQALLSGWNHIAFTGNGAITQILINGIPANTLSIGSPITPLSINKLTLGANNTIYKYFDGSLAELAFWNTAKSNKEIAQSFATIKDVSDETLLAYFRFDNTSGDTLTDKVQNIEGSLNYFNYLTEESDWLLFGAPVGNEQQTINASHITQTIDGPVSVSASGINNSGTVVFRADEIPSNMSGISSPLGQNDFYFGIFQQADLGAIDLTFSYEDYSFAYNNENHLAIYYRENSSDYVWQDALADLDTATKTLTIHNYEHRTGQFMIANNAVPLPVTFGQLSATVAEDYITVYWETESELNNDFFTVEKSYDGENWNAIGTIKGQGTTKDTQSYSYTDYSANYVVTSVLYRIAQTDFDGTTSYSSVITPDIDLDNLVKVFPIPAADELNIEMPTHIDGPISIVNSSGEQVNRIQKSTNNDIVSFNVSDWKNGVYFVRIDTGSDIWQKKIIIRN